MHPRQSEHLFGRTIPRGGPGGFVAPPRPGRLTASASSQTPLSFLDRVLQRLDHLGDVALVQRLVAVRGGTTKLTFSRPDFFSRTNNSVGSSVIAHTGSPASPGEQDSAARSCNGLFTRRVAELPAVRVAKVGWPVLECAWTGGAPCPARPSGDRLGRGPNVAAHVTRARTASTTARLHLDRAANRIACNHNLRQPRRRPNAERSFGKAVVHFPRVEQEQLLPEGKRKTGAW
jgi:hypothetical protein